jgi:hypothetical protein
MAGFEERAEEVLKKSARKRIVDMHHEAKHQCVINYYGSKLGQKVSIQDAREMELTREQYLEVDSDKSLLLLSFSLCFM